jgi:hypothetical protein
VVECLPSLHRPCSTTERKKGRESRKERIERKEGRKREREREKGWSEPVYFQQPSRKI